MNRLQMVSDRFATVSFSFFGLVIIAMSSLQSIDRLIVHPSIDLDRSSVNGDGLPLHRRDSLSSMGFGFYRKFLVPCLLRYCDISRPRPPTTQFSLTAACLPPTQVSHALVALQSHSDLLAWLFGSDGIIMLPHLQPHVCSRNRHTTPLLT